MRSTAVFDTHTYVRKLIAAGVPEPQAEVHASALTELLAHLASKQDIEDLRTATKQDLDLLRQEFRTELNLLRQEFRTELKELELRIAERLRSQMLWFFTVQTALLGIAVAVIKLVP